MHKTITFSDLLLFSYNESSAFKSAHIKSEINFNPTVRKQWVNLISVKNQLDNIQELPSDSIVKKILNYGKTIASIGTISGRRHVYHIN